MVARRTHGLRMTGDLSVTLGRLHLRSALLAAAGTVGYGTEFRPHLRASDVGAVVLKTVTPTPRTGHPPPRLIDTPSGMLNCVGLHNVGLATFVADKWPAARAMELPIIVSVLGDTLEEWEQLARGIGALEGVTALELNLSCPNVTTHHAACGQLTAQDPAATRAVVARVRHVIPQLPLIAKLSPDVTDVCVIAAAATRAGADAVVMGNTFRGMSIDVATRRSHISQPTGGVSGPAIRPLMLARVRDVVALGTTPVIGAGGVCSASDALEYFLVGARAVEVGTAHFADPAALRKIAAGLTVYLKQHRMTRIEDCIGSAMLGGEAHR